MVTPLGLHTAMGSHRIQGFVPQDKPQINPFTNPTIVSCLAPFSLCSTPPPSSRPLLFKQSFTESIQLYRGCSFNTSTILHSFNILRRALLSVLSPSHLLLLHLTQFLISFICHFIFFSIY